MPPQDLLWTHLATPINISLLLTVSSSTSCIFCPQVLIGDEPDEGMENLMEVEIPAEVEEKLKDADIKEEEQKKREEEELQKKQAEEEEREEEERLRGGGGEIENRRREGGLEEREQEEER